MPSFIVFALWVGANLELRGRLGKVVIIPENTNESKGLLPNLVRCQTLEQTGKFPEPALGGDFVARSNGMLCGATPSSCC
jgi:hypothetical protein